MNMKINMTPELREKQKRLEEHLISLGSVLVAYSSGVDSTFLLETAHRLLGKKAVAVTAVSCAFPAREAEEASAFCKRENIEQIIFDPELLSLPSFCENPKDRCYHCKRHIFSEMKRLAAQHGIPYVLEGSNVDDLGDYRPGLIAVTELEIISPLRQAGLTKADIRILSEEIGLPTWNKPSFACLASRFVYGDRITREKLEAIEKAEQVLLDMGFKQFRVRHHGTIARIEVSRNDFERIIDPEISDKLIQHLRSLGFIYIALDLEGYNTGSMNKTI